MVKNGCDFPRLKREYDVFFLSMNENNCKKALVERVEKGGCVDVFYILSRFVNMLTT